MRDPRPIETIPDPDFARRGPRFEGDNAAVIESMTNLHLEETEGRTQCASPPPKAQLPSVGSTGSYSPRATESLSPGSGKLPSFAPRKIAKVSSGKSSPSIQSR